MPLGIVITTKISWNIFKKVMINVPNTFVLSISISQEALCIVKLNFSMPLTNTFCQGIIQGGMVVPKGQSLDKNALANLVTQGNQTIDSCQKKTTSKNKQMFQKNKTKTNVIIAG